MPQIFGVERAVFVVCNHPDRAHRFSASLKGNKQPLCGQGRHRQEIRVTAFEVVEQQCGVAIEHVAARAEVARRASADVRLPQARNGRPHEALFVFGQQTDACRTALEDIQQGIGQGLKHVARRVGQGLRQCHQRAVFRLVIRRPAGAPMQ